MSVIAWDTRVDGELGEASLRRKMAHLGFSVALYHYPQGTSFAPHTHLGDKLDAVLEGVFEIEMQGQRIALTAGEMIFIPARVVHAARVLGTQTVISLDGTRLRGPDSGQ